MFGKFFNKFSKDIAIDLGTANTLIYIKERGIVVNEASIVAVNNRSGEILAVGEEAGKMLGRVPPHISITKPLIDGIISDFEVTEKMLKYFISRLYSENFNLTVRPRVVIGVPLDITEVEKKAVEDVVLLAGAREVYMVENVITSAIGARLPIQDPSGSMVVDIGGGVTEIAIISLSGIVAWKSLRVAGSQLDRDIIQFTRSEYNLIIGEKVAEEAKKNIGKLDDKEEPVEIKMRGRDVVSGLPKEIVINSDQLKKAIQRSISAIIHGIKSTLEITPPELLSDIYQRGMILTGGGAMLHGLEKLISDETKVPVKVIDDPLTCAVRGMGLILEDDNLLREVAIPSTEDDSTLR